MSSERPKIGKTPEIESRKEEEEIKPEFQSLDSISIEEAREGEPNYQTAREVAVDREEPFEKIEQKVREELIKENWWFQKYWREKGTPKEQISIKINGKEIDIYNWSKFIDDGQLKIIQDVLKKFSLISEGKTLKKIKYFLIDDVRGKKHYYTGEEMNGDALG